MESFTNLIDYYRPDWSWSTWGAVSCSSVAAFLGARQVYSIRQKYLQEKKREEEEKQRQEYNDDIRRIQQEIQALRFPQLYELAQLTTQRRLARKKVHLHFDSNDQFVTDEQYQSMAQQESAQLLNSVLVNFVSEQQQLEGTHKITTSIFQGTSGEKVENALCFIENLDKTQQFKQQDSTSKKTSNIEQGFMISDAADDNTEPRSQEHLTLLSGSSNAATQGDVHKDSTQVILNTNPNKFEKPKDQLFIDFFSMYTKRFVKDKQKKRQRSKSRGHKQQQQLMTNQENQLHNIAQEPEASEKHASYKSIEDL